MIRQQEEKKQWAAKKDLSCRKAKSRGQGRGREPRDRKVKEKQETGRQTGGKCGEDEDENICQVFRGNCDDDDDET